MRRLLFAGVLALGGCPSEQPPACTTVIDTSCAPLYVPTFDNVYDNTLAMHCGSTKTACHSDKGMAGGMTFGTEQSAYDGLLDGHVTAGDPACSEVVVRTSMVGHDYTMPKGSSLVAAERCALVQWVAHGAPGPGEPLPPAAAADAFGAAASANMTAARSLAP